MPTASPVFSMNYLIAILAVYRISGLLATDYGPFDLLEKFREKIGVKVSDTGDVYGTNGLARMVICPRCNSMWAGLVVTGIILVIGWDLATWLFLPLALSGATVAIMEIVDHGN